jgi:hypothetical protein
VRAPAATQAITAVVAIVLATGACGGGAADAKYPKRPDGCEVTLYQEIPEAKTDNIGSVRASCAEEVAAEDCLRTLKDQVCRLGGDVVWGVGEPEKRDGKVQYSGRAAHTVGKKR